MLEGNFSKGGRVDSFRPTLPRRRGRVPLLVTQDTSGQPLVRSSSTRPRVVAALMSAVTLFAVCALTAATLAAARAYVKQDRFSWSTAVTLALFCKRKKISLVHIIRFKKEINITSAIFLITFIFFVSKDCFPQLNSEY